MVKLLYKPTAFKCSCGNCGAVLQFEYTDEKRVFGVYSGEYYIVTCPNCCTDMKTRDNLDDYRTPIFLQDSDIKKEEENE